MQIHIHKTTRTKYAVFDISEGIARAYRVTKTQRHAVADVDIFVIESKVQDIPIDDLIYFEMVPVVFEDKR